MLKAIVIGSSAGGIEALGKLLPNLPVGFGIPVFVVQHIYPHSDHYYINMMAKRCPVKLKEAEDNEHIKPGVVYVVPPNRHLVFENTWRISLSDGPKVNFSRPSIDVTFKSASRVFRRHLMGILLTGSNSDGGFGMLHIHQRGGQTIVQSPDDALIGEMPRSALRLFNPDKVLSLAEIGDELSRLGAAK